MASEERDRDMALEWLRECVAIHIEAESPDLPGVRYALALVEAQTPQPDSEPEEEPHPLVRREIARRIKENTR